MGEGGKTVYSGKDKILHGDYEIIRFDNATISELSDLSFDLPPNLSPPEDLSPLTHHLSPSSPSTFDPSPFTLHLLFLTPTRLKFDGRLSSKLEFHILLRNLLRRISLLCYFHCGVELALDFRALIEKSREIRSTKSDLRWYDWERYSRRQETRMMMGGFKGSITFEGALQEFIPFLLLGRYIHVGKGTSFGLGKYEIM